jgi:anti-sigma B factor antagonist
VELRVETADKLVVLSPEGRLLGETATELKEEARRHLLDGYDVVLDLASVVFADSEGLSALVALYKTAATESRRLALCSVRVNLRSLLELTRLHRIFELYEDVESAAAVLEGPTP